MIPVDTSAAPQSAAPLVVFEGIDGSGKGTQAAALQAFLNHAGVSAGLISFPRYRSTFFGQRVGEFLNGDFGSLDQLDPFLISLLYAGDRFESKGDLQEVRQQHQVVVLDRYVPSNVAHQSAKKSGSARQTLQEWIEHIEYRLYELPRPELIFLLDISVELSQQLIRMKQQRTYTDRVTDLQETDVAYLGEVRETYLQMARTQPGWKVISVASGLQARPIEEIHCEICLEVAKTFPQFPLSGLPRQADATI